MLIKKNFAVFHTSGSGKTVGTSWTYGDWNSENSSHHILASIGSVRSGTAPTKLEARVELSTDGGTTTRGPVHVINNVSGGEIEVADGVWEVDASDTNPHMFEACIRAGYAWRLGLKRTGGDGTTAVEARAEISTI